MLATSAPGLLSPGAARNTFRLVTGLHPSQSCGALSLSADPSPPDPLRQPETLQPRPHGPMRCAREGCPLQIPGGIRAVTPAAEGASRISRALACDTREKDGTQRPVERSCPPAGACGDPALLVVTAVQRCGLGPGSERDISAMRKWPAGLPADGHHAGRVRAFRPQRGPTPGRSRPGPRRWGSPLGGLPQPGPARLSGA